MMDNNTLDMSRRNEQTFYSSEYGQGLHAALAGAAIIGIGIYMSKWWLWLIGGAIALIGVNRLRRAQATHSAAEIGFLNQLANTPGVKS